MPVDRFAVFVVIVEAIRSVGVVARGGLIDDAIEREQPLSLIPSDLDCRSRVVRPWGESRVWLS